MFYRMILGGPNNTPSHWLLIDLYVKEKFPVFVPS